MPALRQKPESAASLEFQKLVPATQKNFDREEQQNEGEGIRILVYEMVYL
jgi:hypothetical protein